MTKFIEFVFPCHDCIVSAACRSRQTISRKDLLDKTGGVRCLALPEFNNDTSSHFKNVLECVAQLGWRIGCQLNEDRNMHIPEQYRHFLIEYLGIFEYITNTTSWREARKDVANFDKDEIKRKLDLARRFLR